MTPSRPTRRALLGLGALVIAAAGLVSWALSRDHGWRWELPAFWIWVVGLVALAWIDAHTHRLPRRLIALTAVVAVPLLAAAAMVEDEPRRLWWAALGAAAYLAVMLVLYVVGRGSLGPGDVRLAPLLGAFLGYTGMYSVVAGILIGFGLAAVSGVIGLATKRVGWRSAIAFGPYLCAAAVLAIVATVSGLTPR